MLDTPLYTELTYDSVGADPLGTAASNEMLYRSVFPGINNVVRFVRVYSAICWMVRHIEITARERQVEDMREHAASGMEKIQLLLTWYNRSNIIGLPGGQRVFPTQQADGLASLRFRDTISRNDAIIQRANPDYVAGDGAFYMQAVQYRPSIVNGLQFLNVTPVPGAYRLTEVGELLADAYEEANAEHPWRDWLADPTAISISYDEVHNEMGDLLDLRIPSAPEKQVFLDQLYPACGDLGFGPHWENRQAGITLALRALAAEESSGKNSKAQGIDIETIRYAMAQGVTSEGTPLNLTGIEEVQAWWANLQLRQYLRLAHDSLFRQADAWVKDAVANNTPRDIGNCAKGVGSMLNEVLPEAHRTRVGTLFEELSVKAGKYPSLYAAVATLPSELQLRTLCNNLYTLSAFQQNSEEQLLSLRDIYIALIYCAVEVKNLAATPAVLQEFAGDRLPYSKLLHKVEAHLNASPEEFMEHMVQYYVLLLHFSVVQERSGDGRNRFRILKGDQGLERVTQHQGLSGVSFLADRLTHIFALLEQCGVVRLTSTDQYALTSKGRKRLASFE